MSNDAIALLDRLLVRMAGNRRSRTSPSSIVAGSSGQRDASLGQRAQGADGRGRRVGKHSGAALIHRAANPTDGDSSLAGTAVMAQLALPRNMLKLPAGAAAAGPLKGLSRLSGSFTGASATPLPVPGPSAAPPTAAASTSEAVPGPKTVLQQADSPQPHAPAAHTNSLFSQPATDRGSNGGNLRAVRNLLQDKAGAREGQMAPSHNFPDQMAAAAGGSATWNGLANHLARCQAGSDPQDDPSSTIAPPAMAPSDGGSGSGDGNGGHCLAAGACDGRGHGRSRGVNTITRTAALRALKQQRSGTPDRLADLRGCAGSGAGSEPAEGASPAAHVSAVSAGSNCHVGGDGSSTGGDAHRAVHHAICNVDEEQEPAADGEKGLPIGHTVAADAQSRRMSTEGTSRAHDHAPEAEGGVESPLLQHLCASVMPPPPRQCHRHDSDNGMGKQREKALGLGLDSDSDPAAYMADADTGAESGLESESVDARVIVQTLGSVTAPGAGAECSASAASAVAPSAAIGAVASGAGFMKTLERPARLEAQRKAHIAEGRSCAARHLPMHHAPVVVNGASLTAGSSISALTEDGTANGTGSGAGRGDSQLADAGSRRELVALIPAAAAVEGRSGEEGRCGGGAGLEATLPTAAATATVRAMPAGLSALHRGGALGWRSPSPQRRTACGAARSASDVPTRQQRALQEHVRRRGSSPGPGAGRSRSAGGCAAQAPEQVSAGCAGEGVEQHHQPLHQSPGKIGMPERRAKRQLQPRPQPRLQHQLQHACQAPPPAPESIPQLEERVRFLTAQVAELQASRADLQFRLREEQLAAAASGASATAGLAGAPAAGGLQAHAQLGLEQGQGEQTARVLVQQLAAARDREAELGERLAHARAAHEQLTAQNRTLYVTLDETLSAAEHATTELKGLRAAHAELRAKHECSLQHVSQLQADLELRERALSAVQAEFSSLRRRYEEAVGAAEAARREGALREGRLRREMEAAAQETATAGAALAKLQREHAQLHARKADKDRQLAAVTRRAEAQQEALAGAERLAQEQSALVRELESRATLLRNRNAALDRAVAAEKEARAAAQEQVRQMEEEIALLVAIVRQSDPTLEGLDRYRRDPRAAAAVAASAAALAAATLAEVGGAEAASCTEGGAGAGGAGGALQREGGEPARGSGPAAHGSGAAGVDEGSGIPARAVSNGHSGNGAMVSSRGRAASTVGSVTAAGASTRATGTVTPADKAIGAVSADCSCIPAPNPSGPCARAPHCGGSAANTSLPPGSATAAASEAAAPAVYQYPAKRAISGGVCLRPPRAGRSQSAFVGAAKGRSSDCGNGTGETGARAKRRATTPPGRLRAGESFLRHEPAWALTTSTAATVAGGAAENVEARASSGYKPTPLGGPGPKVGAREASMPVVAWVGTGGGSSAVTRRPPQRSTAPPGSAAARNRYGAATAAVAALAGAATAEAEVCTAPPVVDDDPGGCSSSSRTRWRQGDAGRHEGSLSLSLLTAAAASAALAGDTGCLDRVLWAGPRRARRSTGGIHTSPASARGAPTPGGTESRASPGVSGPVAAGLEPGGFSPAFAPGAEAALAMAKVGAFRGGPLYGGSCGDAMEPSCAGGGGGGGGVYRGSGGGAPSASVRGGRRARTPEPRTAASWAHLSAPDSLLSSPLVPGPTGSTAARCQRMSSTGGRASDTGRGPCSLPSQLPATAAASWLASQQQQQQHRHGAGLAMGLNSALLGSPGDGPAESRFEIPPFDELRTVGQGGVDGDGSGELSDSGGSGTGCEASGGSDSDHESEQQTAGASVASEGLRSGGGVRPAKRSPGDHGGPSCAEASTPVKLARAYSEGGAAVRGRSSSAGGARAAGRGLKRRSGAGADTHADPRVTSLGQGQGEDFRSSYAFDNPLPLSLAAPPQGHGQGQRDSAQAHPLPLHSHWQLRLPTAPAPAVAAPAPKAPACSASAPTGQPPGGAFSQDSGMLGAALRSLQERQAALLHTLAEEPQQRPTFSSLPVSPAAPAAGASAGHASAEQQGSVESFAERELQAGGTSDAGVEILDSDSGKKEEATGAGALQAAEAASFSFPLPGLRRPLKEHVQAQAQGHAQPPSANAAAEQGGGGGSGGGGSGSGGSGSILRRGSSAGGANAGEAGAEGAPGHSARRRSVTFVDEVPPPPLAQSEPAAQPVASSAATQAAEAAVAPAQFHAGQEHAAPGPAAESPGRFGQPSLPPPPTQGWLQRSSSSGSSASTFQLAPAQQPSQRQPRTPRSRRPSVTVAAEAAASAGAGVGGPLTALLDQLSSGGDAWRSLPAAPTQKATSTTISSPTASEAPSLPWRKAAVPASAARSIAPVLEHKNPGAGPFAPPAVQQLPEPKGSMALSAEVEDTWWEQEEVKVDANSVGNRIASEEGKDHDFGGGSSESGDGSGRGGAQATDSERGWGQRDTTTGDSSSQGTTSSSGSRVDGGASSGCTSSGESVSSASCNSCAEAAGRGDSVLHCEGADLSAHTAPVRPDDNDADGQRLQAVAHQAFGRTHTRRPCAATEPVHVPTSLGPTPARVTTPPASVFGSGPYGDAFEALLPEILSPPSSWVPLRQRHSGGSTPRSSFQSDSTPGAGSGGGLASSRLAGPRAPSSEADDSRRRLAFDAALASAALGAGASARLATATLAAADCGDVDDNVAGAESQPTQDHAAMSDSGSQVCASGASGRQGGAGGIGTQQVAGANVSGGESGEPSSGAPAAPSLAASVAAALAAWHESAAGPQGEQLQQTRGGVAPSAEQRSPAPGPTTSASPLAAAAAGNVADDGIDGAGEVSGSTSLFSGAAVPTQPPLRLSSRLDGDTAPRAEVPLLERRQQPQQQQLLSLPVPVSRASLGPVRGVVWVGGAGAGEWRGDVRSASPSAGGVKPLSLADVLRRPPHSGAR